MKIKDINIISALIVLISCTTIITSIFYYRPIIGDDVLYQFQDAAAHYLDHAEMSEHEQILTFSQAAKNSYFFYMNWTGRFYLSFFTSFISVWGKGVIALLTGIIFALFITSILALIFSDWKKSFMHPFTMLMLFLVLILMNKAADYYFMWIMIINSILPSALFFVYLFWINKFCENGSSKNIYHKKFYLLTAIGFLCGIGHEMLGAVLIMMLLGKGISVIFLRKKIGMWSYFRLHIGFYVGYLICFFAPGNFKRINESHDASIYRNYFEKLVDVFQIQKHVFHPLGLDDIGIGGNKYIFLIGIIICAGFIIMIRRKHLKPFLIDNLYLIFGLVSSPFLWALGSYMGEWSTGLWNAIFFILFLRMLFIYVDIESFIPKRIQKYYLNIICLVIAFAFIIITNFTWFHTFIQTSIEWDQKVMQAIEHREEEVRVPLFPDKRILMPSYLNDPIQYETDYYIAYYGIIIIPE